METLIGSAARRVLAAAKASDPYVSKIGGTAVRVIQAVGGGVAVRRGEGVNFRCCLRCVVLAGAVSGCGAAGPWRMWRVWRAPVPHRAGVQIVFCMAVVRVWRRVRQGLTARK